LTRYQCGTSETFEGGGYVGHDSVSEFLIDLSSVSFDFLEKCSGSIELANKFANMAGPTLRTNLQPCIVRLVVLPVLVLAIKIEDEGGEFLLLLHVQPGQYLQLFEFAPPLFNGRPKDLDVSVTAVRNERRIAYEINCGEA
jgi:hypothetical protein